MRWGSLRIVVMFAATSVAIVLDIEDHIHETGRLLQSFMDSKLRADFPSCTAYVRSAYTSQGRYAT